MRKIVVFLLLLSACSSAPVIVDEGPDTFMAYKQGGSAFVGTAPLKIEAMRAATKHCESLKKIFVVVSTNEINGGAFGKYPGAEVHFRCLKEGDRDLNRPTLEPVSSTTIKVQHD
jgi:hypothetical protein